MGVTMMVILNNEEGDTATTGGEGEEEEEGEDIIRVTNNRDMEGMVVMAMGTLNRVSISSSTSRIMEEMRMDMAEGSSSTIRNRDIMAVDISNNSHHIISISNRMRNSRITHHRDIRSSSRNQGRTTIRPMHGNGDSACLI